MFRLSETGFNFIKRHEGLRLTRYLDATGNPTIGYGHLILPGENYTTITRQEAEDLFRRDLARFERAVNDAIKITITQSQFDALVSFTFNVGTGNLLKSSLLRFINAGQFAQAAAEFRKWNKSRGQVLAGLTRRRLEEAAMFIGGTVRANAGTISAVGVIILAGLFSAIWMFR